MRDHSRLAWIIPRKRSLLCKHIHTQYACSHCFIEHLGSISHFKNIGNSTTSVGTEASAMCVCWTRVVPLEGTLNCWCSSASSWKWDSKAQDESWCPDMEPPLGGEVTPHYMGMCAVPYYDKLCKSDENGRIFALVQEKQHLEHTPAVSTLLAPN